MKHPKTDIVGIYLAAGRSSRMGMNKLSLPFKKMPLGSIALETAIHSQLGKIVVVTRLNDELDWVSPSLTQYPFQHKWSQVPCEEADLGQAHSLKCGLWSAQALNPEAIMILLADQPFVSSKMIDELIACYKSYVCEKTEIDYVAASYQGIPRPPILFANRVFPLLLELNGDEGARRLLRGQSPLLGKMIEFEDPASFKDIDTREEYWSLLDEDA